ncbi:site-specific DNA-methyltransferase [Spirosoma sp. KUDC1026]|uniref:site-specific DNA-methyltransferase n=1 Tax=Spirosoma sp. KUDC1026 TaxID=2745947 RepID=UPI00159BEA77|nr:DNA methyltransferase [Spirosoma sp. KUDC1026]QKZ12962.1 site-specific DNA-methyltransferase [Spirosoma sp. KUDC1026]
METIDKLPLTSLEMTDHQREQLKAIFPEVFTESNRIDWDRLRLTLGEAVDTGKERFGLNWPGKADCFKTIQQPSRATLLPAPDEGVNADDTQNVFIEGDNLEVLKLLQKSYLGQVKMIYIDPPYNTGNDFVYPDNYGENLDTYLAYTGQVDEQGRRFATNTDTDGRFHSKWLNMMYPRLFLAKNLLREDGVIFISIDDSELENLKRICSEIFGEENFIELIIWKKRSTPPNDKVIGANHDYILVYCKSVERVKLNLRERTAEQLSRYRNPDDHPKGAWTPGDLMANVKGGRYVQSLYFPIQNPNTGEDHYPSSNGNWRFNQDKIKKLLENDEIYFGEDGKGRPKLKRFLSEVKEGIAYPTIWDFAPLNTDGSKEMGMLLGNMTIFDNPKPSGLIKEVIKIGATQSDIVLDFFAGSATTAHAVLELNKEDGGNRKFVCVQLPEPTAEDSEAGKAGYQTIADISKERIRRVIKRIDQERAQLVEEIRQLEDSIAIKEEQAAERQQTANAGSLFTNTDAVKNQVKAIHEQITKLREKIAEKEAQIERIDTTDKGFRVFKLAPSNFNVWDASVAKTPEAIQTQLFNHIDHIRAGATQADLLTELLLKSGFPLTTPVETLTLAGKTVYSVADGELLVCLEEQLTQDVIKAIADRRPSRVICLDAGFQHNDPLKTNATLLMKDRGVVKFQTV